MVLGTLRKEDYGFRKRVHPGTIFAGILRGNHLGGDFGGGTYWVDHPEGDCSQWMIL